MYFYFSSLQKAHKDLLVLQLVLGGRMEESL